MNREKLDNNVIEVEEGVILDYHVLDGMADWVRVIDQSGIVIFVNSAMKRAMGDSVGKRCFEAYCREKSCTFCIAKRSVEHGEVMQKEQVINGRYYSVKSSPLMDKNGRINAAVEVFRDVTRERKLELELINRNRMMSKDLLFAKKIQEQILPYKGRVGNITIDHIYKPSEMLSGDMFDVFELDDETIGIYICDVVGHGIAASMMTMFIRQTMRGVIEDIKSPGETLSELYKVFVDLELEASQYFTMFYGTYNKKNQEFTFANAGHNCSPVKFNCEGYDLLELRGLPITRLFDEMDYDEEKINLTKGDKILFYTDGITEAKDHNGKEFGVEGILETIIKNPNNLLEEIENKYIYHSWGEQDDDYALVLMDVIE